MPPIPYEPEPGEDVLVILLAFLLAALVLFLAFRLLSSHLPE